MAGPAVADARAWMDECTALFLGAVDKLGDEAFTAPSGLPGWSRSHVISHMGFNARAIGRLVSWAATGTEQRMYPSREHRNAEIEEGAGLPAAQLRELVHGAADELAAAMDALSSEAWQAQIVTAQGRAVPATELPWMRAKEAGIHAVDLATGLTFADLPDGLITALVPEVAAKRAAGPEGAPLAAWLTGRSTDAPELGPWL